jgi:hypothetical protein
MISYLHDEPDYYNTPFNYFCIRSDSLLVSELAEMLNLPAMRKYKSIRVSKVEPVDIPCRKTAYNSPDEAQAAIVYIRQTKYVKDLSAYRCSICGFWHLTSK